jgi:hypothetical protein
MSPTPPQPRPFADEWGEYVAGALMAVAGLIGLFMASGAHDDEIYVFGLSLTGMAAWFILRQIKRHYDLLDAQRAQIAADHHG